MQRPLRLIAAAVALSAAATAWAGDGKRAILRGGTVGLMSGIGGDLTLDAEEVTFKPASGQTLRISYKEITALEFGPQAGTRVPMVMIGSNDKKAQYLTINWMREGNEAQIVLELSKDAVDPTLAALETKTGKAVHRQTPVSRQGSR